jgi:hypothetical protein
MPRPPEDEITQQADDSAVRAAWNAFDAGHIDTLAAPSSWAIDRRTGLSAGSLLRGEGRPGAMDLVGGRIERSGWASPELAFAELLAGSPEKLAEGAPPAGARSTTIAEEEDEYCRRWR